MKRLTASSVVFVLFLLSVSCFSAPVFAADTPTAVTPELYQVVLQKMYTEKILEGSDPATLTDEQVQAIASAVASASVMPKIGGIAKTQDGYVATTGTTGIARGVLPVGRYRVDVKTLDNFVFTILSKELIIDKNAGVYFGIGIQEKKGKGSVVADITSAVTGVVRWMQQLFRKSSDSSTPVTVFDTNTVIMQSFHDVNGNGKPDSGEKPVEWANVLVTLTKISTEQTIVLSAGTTSVLFDAQPRNLETVKDFAKRAYVATGSDVSITYVTQGKTNTVSVVRGVTSGTDAPITPHVSYQVQTTFEGSVLAIY